MESHSRRTILLLWWFAKKISLTGGLELKIFLLCTHPKRGLGFTQTLKLLIYGIFSTCQKLRCWFSAQKKTLQKFLVRLAEWQYLNSKWIHWFLHLMQIAENEQVLAVWFQLISQKTQFLSNVHLHWNTFIN